VADSSFDAAFDELYPLAVRLAARVLGDQSAAEDVAAEALSRAYARWAYVSALPYRDAWVLKVAGNVAIDVLRRRKPLVTPELSDAFEDTTALRLALASALAKLPRRQREAVVLRYLGGYSEAEVSAVLGISSNSVKTHLQRGLTSLRNRLGEPERSNVAVL
jgi:RNA polymerase sigma-70 factor (ECF subfamily)